jgi:hypothetical protein
MWFAIDFTDCSVVLGRLRLRPAGTVKPKCLSYMSYQRSIYVLPLDDPSRHYFKGLTDPSCFDFSDRH